MRVLSLRRLTFLALVPLAACGGDAAGPPKPALSDSAASYLNAALDIMQAHSVNRRKLDWPALRARAVARAGAAQTYAATYPAIRQALVELGDHHSFFREPGASVSLSPVLPAGTMGTPAGRRIDGKIGYVLVPEFSGGGAPATDYAATLHTLIAGIDTGRVCGWVVDLRGNRGGNMWPMLTGVGPILGNGNPGRFVEWDGTVVSTWYYLDGVSGLTPGGVVVQVSNAYKLRTPAPAVAVLHDGMTASSGEAIVVAFRGRPDTRSFGTPTYGVPTANAGYGLRDGATIVLTVALDADRNNHIYSEAIAPDQVTTSAGALDAGVSWLEARPECK